MEEETDNVTLYVFGLKSIITEPVTAVANLDSTWYEFLNEDCGIQVRPEDAVMAATTSYSLPAKRGWSADLSEKIRTFVERFAIKKDKYSVRLMMQLPPPATQNEEAEPVTKQSRNLRNSKSEDRQTSGRSNVKRRYAEGNVKSVPNRRTKTKVIKKQRNSYSIGSHVYRNGNVVIEEEVEDDDPAYMNEEESLEIDQEGEQEDNNLPEATPIVLQNHRRIPKNRSSDIKPVVKERFKRFSNAFLLLVNNEIRKLQRTGLFVRNVQHSPLASYLLQELFME